MQRVVNKPPTQEPSGKATTARVACWCACQPSPNNCSNLWDREQGEGRRAQGEGRRAQGEGSREAERGSSTGQQYRAAEHSIRKGRCCCGAFVLTPLPLAIADAAGRRTTPPGAHCQLIEGAAGPQRGLPAAAAAAVHKVAGAVQGPAGAALLQGVPLHVVLLAAEGHCLPCVTRCCCCWCCCWW